METPKEFDVCYIDCDLIKYRSSFAAEKTYWHLYDADGEWRGKYNSAKECDNELQDLTEFMDIDTEGWVRKSEKIIGEEEQAIKACDLIIKHIQKKCPAKRYKYYLTGNDTYRPEIATLHKYKGNRDNMPKPTYIEQVTQHIIDKYNAIVVDEIEADDCLCVGLTTSTKKGLKAVAANLDKDVRQGYGWHFDWLKDAFEFITEEEGIKWCYIQSLAGDMSVDNYQGIPGIGKVKAKKILDNCETEREMYEAAVQAYKDYFGEEYHYKSWDGKDMKKNYHEIFLENMRLAYMQREKGKFYQIPKEE